MILTHRIQLDPTCKQRQYFAQAAGCARFVWNWAVAEWERQYKAGEKPNGMKLKKEFNAIKYEQFPWMKDVHRDAHAVPFANLDKAFKRFFKKTTKRPKFKKKGRCRDSFAVANDKFRTDGKIVILPKIGRVRLTEPLRLIGKLTGAVVSRTADHWFISFEIDVGDYSQQRLAANTVGIDLGIKTLATLSTGEQIHSPRPLKTQLKKLARANRSLHRKQKGSQNRQKSKRKLAKIHARIANIRKDFLHKLTTRLCRQNQTVVIEDLNVSGLQKNKRLARSIGDMGFYEFRRQLTYKAAIYSVNIVIADRFFPSSKTCSSCGRIKDDLTLKDRTYSCSDCGLQLDRDHNAAINLCTLGLRETYACGRLDNPDEFQLIGAGPDEAGTITCPDLDIL